MLSRYSKSYGNISVWVSDYLVAVRIDEMIEASNTVDPECKWFLFGSLCRGQSAPSDVDLLILSDTIECCIKIRERLRDFVDASPVDLSIMTWKEERELNFISNTRAQPLHHSGPK
jgi:predicted nucleotidyltransferase